MKLIRLFFIIVSLYVNTNQDIEDETFKKSKYEKNKSIFNKFIKYCILK